MTLLNGQDTGGASTASASTFTTLPPGRSASFAIGATSNGMMASNYLPNPNPIRPPGSSAAAFPGPIAKMSSTNGFERDLSSIMSNQFDIQSSMVASPKHTVLVRRLPIDTTDEKLRFMTLFSQELVSVELLSPDLSDDAGYRSAILAFESPNGAHEAKANLHGKLNSAKDTTMLVEVLDGNSLRRSTVDLSSDATPASSASSSRASGRPPRSFQSLESVQPSMAGLYGNGAHLASAADLVNSEPVGPASHYTMFPAQSPIGNHLTDRTRMSSRDLINNVGPTGDDTLALLQDSLAYADDTGLSAAITAAGLTGPHQVSLPPHQQQRRATAPQVSLNSRLAGLSLNTAAVNGPINGSSNGAAPLPPTYAQNGGSLSAHPMTMSPVVMNGPTISSQMYPHRHRHGLPAVNLSDQNPPCNTLYVGNLPANASEEELKAMFARQRGYKRLCFRTKSNGPMCFVEFDDITFATKALTDLYGKPLHNSLKGGIRLSFSKNPLGVRSGQNPNFAGSNSGPAVSMGAGSMPPNSTGGNGFGMNNGPPGPPPGLSAPPGLNGGRMYHTNGSIPQQYGIQTSALSSPFPVVPRMGPSAHPSNGWGDASLYNGPFDGDNTNSNSLATGGSPAAYPAFMMGR